ncbi:hypothetical protein [Legionella sp. CNM-4043-24]|uniref:hypothetical protein n=1 Tax=Legionella sp. CNM-4043-24 TaxID=3421646 RepID=UPI00403AA812
MKLLFACNFGSKNRAYHWLCTHIAPKDCTLNTYFKPGTLRKIFVNALQAHSARFFYYQMAMVDIHVVNIKNSILAVVMK